MMFENVSRRLLLLRGSVCSVFAKVDLLWERLIGGWGGAWGEEAPPTPIYNASDRDHDVDDEENRFIIIKIYKMKSRSSPRRSEMCARHRPKINTEQQRRVSCGTRRNSYYNLLLITCLSQGARECPLKHGIGFSYVNLKDWIDLFGGLVDEGYAERWCHRRVYRV